MKINLFFYALVANLVAMQLRLVCKNRINYF